jgi:hypothetical protein
MASTPLPHTWFTIGLSAVLTHEMDAIRCREYRMFPITELFDDRPGYLLFTGVHFPLYIGILLGTSPTAPTRLREGLITALDVFSIIHIFLHVRYYFKHPLNEFTTGFSWFWIVGWGVCGALDLIMTYRAKRKKSS